MSSLKRIHMHWTAGSHVPNAHDRHSYNFLVTGKGVVVNGDFAPEAQIKCVAGHYAEHTYHANTGAIGISMAAMLNAIEVPFNAGPFPITEVQLEAFCQLAAHLCVKYDIPVTPATVLTHAEIQPTLGVVQKQKWDIRWLPGMSHPIGAIEAGDILRAKITALLPGFDATYSMLQRGDKGAKVITAQARLNKNGFNLIVDGDFGPRTEEAVSLFQAVNKLTRSGIVDKATWTKLLEGN